MKILAFGDVYGRIGRKALLKQLPILKKQYAPDFIIVNVDNISSGRGPIKKHILDLAEAGVDLMTSGDHVFDNYNKIEDLLNEKKPIIIRPINFFESKDYKISGSGYRIIEKDGKNLLVIHLIGQVFTKFRVDNPFLRVDEFLNNIPKEKIDGIIIDFHKEATSEGYGLAKFLDGRVSLIYGTHTHVQTNDEQISKNNTGFISDIGMNGPLDSIIGADFKSVESIFLTGVNYKKMEQSLDNNYLVSGIFVEIGNNKKCEKIEKIRIKDTL